MNEKQEKKKPDFIDSFPNKIIRELLKTGKEKQAFAKAMGVSDEAVRQWIGGYAQPGVKKLIEIANYFNISMDYLFGMTGVPDKSIEVQAIHEITGLSENAIKNLTEFKDATGVIELVNYLLEKDFFMEFNFNIKNYEYEMYKHKIALEDESLQQVEYLTNLSTLTEKVQKLNEILKRDYENKNILSREELEVISRLREIEKKIIQSPTEDVSIINDNSNIPLNRSIVSTDEAKQIALWRIGRLSEKIADEYVKRKETI